MLIRVELRNLAIKALKQANTLAEDRIFSPMDWPTTPAMYPVILVKTPRERKVSESRSIPKFTTTAELHLSLRIEGNSEAEATDTLEALCEQVENAILTDCNLVREVQQFSYVDTYMEVNSDQRKHFGEAILQIGMEFYEVFDPQLHSPHAPIAESLEGVDIQYEIDSKEIKQSIDL